MSFENLVEEYLDSHGGFFEGSASDFIKALKIVDMSPLVFGRKLAKMPCLNVERCFVGSGKNRRRILKIEKTKKAFGQCETIEKPIISLSQKREKRVFIISEERFLRETGGLRC